MPHFPNVFFQSADGLEHFSTYALDGKTGALKWKHEPGDFEAETSAKEVRPTLPSTSCSNIVCVSPPPPPPPPPSSPFLPLLLLFLIFYSSPSSLHSNSS